MRDGFVDTSKEIQDSIKDIRGQLNGMKEITLVDAKENAEIMQDILSGKKGAKQDIVIFNSAVALYIAGKAKNLSDGIKLAEESINSGKAKKVLEKVIKETQQYA